VRSRHRRFVPLLLTCVLTIAPAAAFARESPSTGDAYTPIDPTTLIAQASVKPDPLLPDGTFRLATYGIRSLSWEQLPLNGRSLARLSRPSNADEDGIAYTVVNGRNYYHPGNIADEGIRFVDSYVRTGKPWYLDGALLRAIKLRELGIVQNGALFVPYQFNYSAERLKAPWVSAYSQGLALSFFVRLYRVTGDQADLDTAQQVFRSFRRLGASSAFWVSYVRSGELWLEEYPSSRPTHVLNVFGFATFGLYDYERLTRDPAARQLLLGALSTIRHNVRLYRVPGEISLYDLVHRTQHKHYHDVVVWQMRDIGLIARDPYFSNLASVLEADGS
jgi:hypothetical protein